MEQNTLKVDDHLTIVKVIDRDGRCFNVGICNSIDHGLHICIINNRGDEYHVNVSKVIFKPKEQWTL